MPSPPPILTLAIPLLLRNGSLRPTIEQLGTAERTDFYPLVGDVDPLVNHVVSAPDLLTRACVTVDGAARTVAAPRPASARAPGPR